MYVAAGFLCADRAGAAWEDLVRKRVFEPLSMTASTVSVKRSQQLSALELTAYAGKYSHPAFGTIEVRHEGDELNLSFPAWSSKLVHSHHDTFSITRLTGAPAQFQLDSESKIARLLLPLEPAVKPFVFQRQ